jgi:hypothetical protein
VLAIATLAAWLPVSAEGETLKWGREPARVAKNSAATASLHFTRPQTPSRRIDPSVRPTVFEDDAPQLTSGNGPAQTRSVVVNHDDSPNALRSAQRPPSSPGAGASGQPSADSQLQQNIGTPFGDMPEPPAIEPPAANQFEPSNLPMPETNTLQVDETQRQPTPPTANEFQPNVPPVGAAPAQTAPSELPEPNQPTNEPDREKSQTACTESLEKLKAKTIGTLSLDIAVTGNEGSDYPYECTVSDGAMFDGRCWDQQTYLWKASALCHKPLYFEDEQLERYGHSFTPCFQPLVSGAHFFTRLPVLPYCMGVEPPCECIYALGHYRPGDCAPYMCNPIPLSCRGALFEAGAVTGAAAAIP